jgi:bifunctional non-homologous end joining protein LigD
VNDADRLSDYRAKRDFHDTPEPVAAPGGSSADAAPRFVVQEHHARRLHWDLRLEHEGTLASWAVPRGIPPDPERNNLAVRTEDHPLEYLTFHGEIPAGNYGAGTMEIWDRGTYELHKWRDDEVMITLHGERVQGRYVLFRTRGDDWMIHRMDPPQDPGREPMPETVAPMLARSGPLPADQDRWGFEIKWDGVRAIAYAEGGRLRLTSRSGRDISAQYPEVRGLGEALGSTEAVLDGEIVAFGEDGLPSFQVLQRRMHVASERQVQRLAREHPVAYVVFDLLWRDGHSLMEETYAERRAALLDLGLRGAHWQVPGHHVGDGDALLELSRRQGLEGIVAKRLDCPYTPGRRSSGWVKVKNVRRASVVVGGWLPGERGRSGRLGALCVGYHDEDGALRYAGRVGTGFSEGELVRVGRLLEPLAAAASPFEGRQPPRQARFVRPSLVAEVEFSEWTQTRTLRAPSYKGLRDDLDAAQVGWDPGA